MREIYIKYNPYTVKTKLMIDGENVDKTTAFYHKLEGVRLQEWIEPEGGWKGLFGEISSLTNTKDEIKLIFEGTDLDFADIEYVRDRYGNDFDNIELVHIKGTNHNNKIVDLKKKFQELKEGPVDELKTEEIQRAFEKGISTEFEIVVIAPMSSGKSTLINAIIGDDLLPAINQATTATIYRIKDDDSCEGFLVNCKDKSGKILVRDERATLTLLNQLNQKANEIDCIDIRGNIPNINSDKVNIVFVDTPGGNNSQDENHAKVMKNAINDENKGMILFVFNYTQLETDDCDNILNFISQAMKRSSLGKQSRDRFIFVCNKMDAQDTDKESYDFVIDKIKRHLRKYDIKEPNLFLTCADVAKLIRMDKEGKKLTESDEDRLDGYLKPFNRPSRQLFRYASIPEIQKEKYQLQANQIGDTGEKRSPIVAEINSGIPALEEALKRYIEKYAIAIKVKTVHDIFMSKVEEMDMINKCYEAWTESNDSYNEMREELETKIEQYNKNQKLQEFKNKIEDINIDYEPIEMIQVEILMEIRRIPYKYRETIKKSEADILMKEVKKKISAIGYKAQKSLENVFEDCVYGECKQILKDYREYIQELDKAGFLNVLNFNFKKIKSFSNLDMQSLSDSYVETLLVDKKKVKKAGLFNGIKRFFGASSGWADEEIYEDFVKIKDFMDGIASKLSDILIDEIEEEIERVKDKEKKVKEFAQIELNNIDNVIQTMLMELKEKTEDKVKLEEEVIENKIKAQWIDKFIKEMDRILDI